VFDDTIFAKINAIPMVYKKLFLDMKINTFSWPCPVGFIT